MRIAFLKDWDDDLEHIGGNCDGILAAISLLSMRHELDFYTKGTYGSLNQYGINYKFVKSLPDLSSYNIIVTWGSLDRPWHEEIAHYKIPKILCFAGGPTVHPYLHNFDHVLVESKVYEEAFNKHIIGVSRAFGTNIDVFRPDSRTTKVFDAIYPASFCFHKNIELFARAMGPRGLAVGNWNELDIVGKCLQFHTPVMRRVSSATLCDLYNLSRVCVVPCGPAGGAQRVVLEAMSCGVPVVLANDNDKCREFVEDSGFGRLVNPVDIEIREAVNELIEYPLDQSIGRNYIMSKWTHHHYAESIEESIKEVLRERASN